jgi:hypothetical protein
MLLIIHPILLKTFFILVIIFWLMALTGLDIYYQDPDKADRYLRERRKNKNRH